VAACEESSPRSPSPCRHGLRAFDGAAVWGCYFILAPRGFDATAPLQDSLRPHGNIDIEGHARHPRCAVAPSEANFFGRRSGGPACLTCSEVTTLELTSASPRYLRGAASAAAGLHRFGATVPQARRRVAQCDAQSSMWGWALDVLYHATKRLDCHIPCQQNNSERH
jgi:hypothetical protein